MTNLIKIMYDCWIIISVCSIVLGIISAFWKRCNTKNDNNEANKSGKQIINTICIGLFVVILLIVAVVQLSFVYVPDISYKSVREAKVLLDECNLELSLPNGVVYNDQTEQYLVNKQYIEHHELVLKGTTIQVELDYTDSTYFVPVPDVVGLNYLDAVSIIKNRDLLYSTSIMSNNDGNLEDLVISNQSIAANSMVAKNTIINLFLVSPDSNIDKNPNNSTSNNELITVPKVIDMEEQAAVETLESLGFQAIVRYNGESDEKNDKYYIIDQSIPAGSKIPVGTTIELERSTVKLGTPVVVPDVIGMEQIEATEYLVSLGLRFQVWWTEENNVAADYYYIVDQSVPSGTVIDAGTVIKLELSARKP